jgi:DNA polymerase III subunit epsilon
MIGTFIAIDTETTGLSFETDRVIEIGIAIFIKGKCVRRTSFLLNVVDVPNTAVAINGITGEMLSDGHDPEWAFALVSSIMHKQPRLVLAYNAPFDLMMLANEFRRHGIVYDYNRIRVIDPLVIERHHRVYAKNKLVNVIERYRLPYDETIAHRAGQDAELAGHIWMVQQIRYGLSHMNPSVIQDKLFNWAKEWQDNFEAYKAMRGHSVTMTPWPYDPAMCSFLEGEQSLLW